MPKPKYVRPIKARRRFKKKTARKHLAKTVINRGISPLPSRYITRLKYNEIIDHSVTSAVTLDYQFRLNGLYDPNSTGAGHQPMGRDTLALLYNRYRVFAVSWCVTVYPSGQGASIMVLPNNNGANYNSVFPYVVTEQPRCITKVVNLDSPTIFKGHINLANICGVTSTQYKGDDRFQAAVGADPVEVINLSNVIYSAATTTRSVSYQLIYHVEFFDPVAQGAS